MYISYTDIDTVNQHYLPNPCLPYPETTRDSNETFPRNMSIETENHQIDMFIDLPLPGGPRLRLRLKLCHSERQCER